MITRKGRKNVTNDHKNIGCKNPIEIPSIHWNKYTVTVQQLGWKKLLGFLVPFFSEMTIKMNNDFFNTYNHYEKLLKIFIDLMMVHIFQVWVRGNGIFAISFIFLFFFFWKISLQIYLDFLFFPSCSPHKTVYQKELTTGKLQQVSL